MRESEIAQRANQIHLNDNPDRDEISRATGGLAMPEPPTGTITFLFTDIEGSTVRWERYPEIMSETLERHDMLLRHIMETHRGFVFKTAGDAFYVAFPTAP